MYFSRKAAGGALALVLAGGGLTLAASPASAAISVSATTQITGRADSGYATQPVNSANTWATDDMTRTATVTLVGTHTGAECGTLTSCYQYTGSVKDTAGTFTTVTGGVSPNAGAPLVNPPVTGTFTGGAENFTFYADSNAPVSSLPDSASGQSPIDTTHWLTLMFPQGTSFAGANPSTGVPGDTNVADGILLPNWSWTYKDAGCEQWVDAYNVSQKDSGDITGANQCPPPPPTVTVTGPGPINTMVNHTSCLDNSDFNWAAGNPLQIWACGAAGGVDQKFELRTVGSRTDLRAVAPAGKSQGPWCVTPPDGANGQLTIQLCDGSALQAVVKSGSKYVFTGDAGRVMDLRASVTVNGNAVIAYPLKSPTGINQQWGLP